MKAEEGADLVIKDVYIEDSKVNVKYCNGENASVIQDGAISFPDTFYVQIEIDNEIHTGTSGNTNYMLAVPDSGYCKIYDDRIYTRFGCHFLTPTYLKAWLLQRTSGNPKNFSRSGSGRSISAPQVARLHAEEMKEDEFEILFEE